MRAEHILAYAHRRWDLVDALKAEFWANEKPRLGASAALRLGDDLRRQALALHPDWPSDLERANDIDMHAEVARMLRLALPQRNR